MKNRTNAEDVFPVVEGLTLYRGFRGLAESVFELYNSPDVNAATGKWALHNYGLCGIVDNFDAIERMKPERYIKLDGAEFCLARVLHEFFGLSRRADAAHATPDAKEQIVKRIEFALYALFSPYCEIAKGILG